MSADRTVQPLNLGSCEVRFMNRAQPDGTDNQAHRNINNSSVICKVECGAKSFLFTGDLERDGEDELLESRVPLKSSVLKVGHHGGKTSTSRRFLEAVRPEVAVILNDYPGSPGSPNREVLARLESAGVRTFWTGRDGAVVIETDGKAFSITTGRKKKIHDSSGKNVPK